MNKKGFTLVELLMVIVIMGVISSLTLPSLFEVIKESQNDKKESIENLILQELKMINKDVGEEDFWYEDKEEKNLLGTAYQTQIENDIDLNGYDICTLTITKDNSGNEVLLGHKTDDETCTVEN